MDNPQYLVVNPTKKIIIPTGEQVECVVCDLKNVPYELHHVVPRHLGGSKGPVVNICGGCHQMIHNAALVMKTGKAMPDPDDDSWNAVKKEKYAYLVRVIFKAMVAAEGHFGKVWKYSRIWTDEEHNQLIRLAKIYGSQDRALEVALEKLHKSHFGDSK